MPRQVDAATTALLDSADFAIFNSVFVETEDGVFAELSDWTGAFRFSENIDDAMAAGTIEFIREADIGGVRHSLSPLVTASPLNRNAAAEYSPRLNSFRGIRIMESVVPKSAVGPGITYPLFEGDIVDPEWGGDKPRVSTTMRGRGARLTNAWIKDIIPIPSMILPDVIQTLVNVGGIVETLVVEAGADWQLEAFKQQAPITVHDSIWAKAQQIGLVVRYKWMPDNTMKLVLYNPQRDKTVPDLTLAPGKVLGVSRINLGGTQMRNSGRLWYTDPSTGAQVPVDYVDQGSIDAHNGVEQWFQLAEEATSQINSRERAELMIQSAVMDMSIPFANMEIKMHADLRIMLDDLLRFPPYQRYFDEQQDWAVVGYTQERGGADARGARSGSTSVKVRGRPAGGFTRWIRSFGDAGFRSARLPAPILGPLYGESSPDGGSTDDGGVWLDYEFDEITEEIWVFAETGEESPLPAPSLDENQLSIILRRPEGKIGADPKFKSKHFMATTPDYFKRVYAFGKSFSGVRGLPYQATIQAVDAIEAELAGATGFTITRLPDANQLNWTAPAQVSPQPVYWGIRRGGINIQFIEHIEGPMEFLDDGLMPDNQLDYEVFPWSFGISGGSVIDISPEVPPPESPGSLRPFFTNGAPRVVTDLGQSPPTQYWFDYEVPDAGAEYVDLEFMTSTGVWARFDQHNRINPTFIGRFATSAFVGSTWRLVSRDAAFAVREISQVGHLAI
jgi:hypothetical protein